MGGINPPNRRARVSPWRCSYRALPIGTDGPGAGSALTPTCMPTGLYLWGGLITSSQTEPKEKEGADCLFDRIYHAVLAVKDEGATPSPPAAVFDP